MPNFQVISDYIPSGDQPEAIDRLAQGVELGLEEQTLLGVTGSGKTFTMAKVIERLQRPTLVLAHNKTLAAQLCAEFKEFFPNNAVEYFVSYYDYYQPEAYIPHTDTFIEKDSAINDEIERLRHSATSALFERRDVIVVASVSCIYGLGDPIDYANMVISLRTGQERPMEELLNKLTEIRYERNDVAFDRNRFRVRGDTVEIFPVYANDRAIRVEFFGDEIDRISEINVVTGTPTRVVDHVAIYPASHYVASKEKMAAAIDEIYREMEERVAFFKANDQLLEAQRISQRTLYDIEMMRELGYCSGIENYSRVIEGRAPGSPPHTLLDYFPAEGSLLFFSEGNKLKERMRTTLWQWGEDLKSYLAEGVLCKGLDTYSGDWEYALGKAQEVPTLFLDLFARGSYEVPTRTLVNMNVKQLPVWGGGTQVLAEDLRPLLDLGRACVVLCGTRRAGESLGRDGRVLVRVSGTEPLIRVMVEAATDELCGKYVDQVIDVIRAEGLVVG